MTAGPPSGTVQPPWAKKKKKRRHEVVAPPTAAPGGGPDLPGVPAKKKQKRAAPPKTVHVQPGPKTPSHTKKKKSKDPQGRQRSERPYHYGKPDRFPDLVHRPAFRYALVRANREIIELRHVENVTWDDSNAILTGTLTFREPVFDDDPTPIPIPGERVICQANDGSGWREVWMMRIYKPVLAVENREYTYNLTNDLDLLRQSQGYFKYVGDHAHPNGWYGHEIIADVCKQFNVPIGALYKGKKRRAKLVMGNASGGPGVSPLDVIRNQLLWELRHNGPRLVLSFIGGRLYVLPLRRSPHLLQLGPTLTSAAFSSELPPEFGSALIIRGLPEYFDQANADNPKQKQKAHVQLESNASRARFGYVQRIVFSPDAKSDADLRKEGLAYLNVVAKPIKKLTMTHPGLPFLKRGDAIQLALGDQGIRRQIVWVQEAQHNVTADEYTTTLTVIFDDPYIDRRTESILFRLKATHDAAVGNRAQNNPTWWAGNPKDDAPRPSRQSNIFTRAAGRVGGRTRGD